MRKSYLIQWMFLMVMAVAGASKMHAQEVSDVVQVKDDMLVITLNKKHAEEFKNLILYFGLNADSLFEFGNIGSLAKDGWKLQELSKNKALIARPLNADADHINWGNQPIFFDTPFTENYSPGYPGPVAYGINSFSGKPTVFENSSDYTVFYLPNHLTAKQVILSGNFNDWSTSQTVMQKTDSGWIASVHLIPGKYFYKFIIDGEWIYDLNNNVKEDDGYGSYNSTYFHHNYTFRLNGYTGAKKVILAGEFNNWNEKELPMKKTANGWELNLYIGEGTHTYKFIVDGEWILDPANKTVRPDGNGNINSVMGIGDSTHFTLNGFTDAHIAILSGSFNNWNAGEIVMNKTATGWEVPYILAPGNYEYKYIVDGNWITDPANPLQISRAEGSNSLLVVKPNYTFHLDGNTTAKTVYVSGSFCDWAEPGYPMLRDANGWKFPIYLPAGKYTYKFIVDGNWIIDPANDQYEENEYSTGNSVIWIDPKNEFLEK